MLVFAAIFVVLLSAFTAVMAALDWRTRRLPNAITVPAAVSGILFNIAYGVAQGGVWGGGHGLLFSLAGFAVGFGILWVLWLIGAGGGGDVKLMGALGAWLGAWTTLIVLLASAVLAITCSTAAMAYFVIRPRKANESRLRKQDDKKEGRRIPIPYAIPVALATWCVLGWYLWHGFEIPTLTI